jgi:CubicO group peptidase (beta-lactamase class C family)
MKYFKKIFIVAVVLFSLIYTFDLNYLIKGVRVVYLNGYTTVFIDDNEYFDTVQVETSDTPEPWPQHINYNKRNLSNSFDDFNSEMETAAFLVFKNDSIITEKYYNGYNENSVINSFSIVKTLISVSLAKAIEQGYIKGLEQKVIDFIPELKGEFANEVTVEDLISMQSGMKWVEPSLNPFSVIAKTYFINDINKLMLEQPYINQPGINFHYSSGNTQVLAIVIERATGQKITDYFSENFWKKMNAEKDAIWQLDSYESGNAKAFCCFSTNARDLSRMGKLYINNGSWNGEQLVSEDYIKNSLTPRDTLIYGLGVWMTNYRGHEIGMMRGHLGQYIMFIPEKNIIISRFGREYIDKGIIEITEDTYVYIDEALRITDN